MRTHRTWFALVGIAALAAALRAIGLENTFPGGANEQADAQGQGDFGSARHGGIPVERFSRGAW